MNEAIIALIGFYSGLYGVDPMVALSVAQTESGMNSSVVGSANERGVFQLKPSSFPQFSIKQLRDNKVNIREGIKYLAWTKQHCKHQNNIDWLTCYNAGIVHAVNIKHPSEFNYVKKVRKNMEVFKKGHKVMVEKLYAYTVAGECEVLGISNELGSKGYYKIRDEYGNVLKIEPERVKDYDSYWADKKNIASKH